MKTLNVSSQLTLILKIFVPTFWIAFFGTLSAFLIFSEEGNRLISGGLFTPFTSKLVVLLFFISGILLLYYFIMRLKRVEMGTDFFITSNYHKTFKHSYESIKKVEERKFLFLRPTTIYFKVPGTFGKKITFLASDLFEEFLGNHPEIARHFRSE